MHASWLELDSSQNMVQDGNIEVDLVFEKNLTVAHLALHH